MLRFLALAPALFFALTNSGCATMFADDVDTVTIESDPAGADIYYRGELIGKTPLTRPMQRRAEAPFYTLKKSGYENRNVALMRSMDKPAFLNFGFITTTSGATSWGIDLLTGKMWRYAPNSYVTKLEPATANQWNEPVFDYVMTNSENLKKDFARQEGIYMQSFCQLLGWTEDRCKNFAKKAAATPAVMQAPESLSLYRELKKVEAPTSEKDSAKE